MIPNKTLAKLLIKFRKANRARLTAYARRSRARSGVAIFNEKTKQWERVFRVEVTPELEQKLNADVEVARLHKLKVSAEVQAYCKKRNLHLSWNTDNHITAVHSENEWVLRRGEGRRSANNFIVVLTNLGLSKQLRWFR